jgi:hypothetical protein
VYPFCNAFELHNEAQLMETSIVAKDLISKDEIAWMLQHRKLEFNEARCLRDYPTFGKKMIGGTLFGYLLVALCPNVLAFRSSKFEYLLPCTNWPGIGTRWQLFLDWLNT